MKKILGYFVMFGVVLSMITPLSAKSIERDPDLVNYDLDSRSIVSIDGSEYIEEIYVQKIPVLQAYSGLVTNHNDAYIYALKAITPDQVGATLEETSSHLSYAVKIKATITYNSYKSSTDSAKYYKITKLGFSVIELESPCEMLSTELRIDNNGVTDTGGEIYQSVSKNIGSATTGTLNGDSSWVPAYSWEGISVMGIIQSTIKRGQGSYNISWSRVVG